MSKCVWTQQGYYEGSDTYSPSCCGHLWTFVEGTPEGKFCIYCGEPIEVVLAEDPYAEKE